MKPFQSCPICKDPKFKANLIEYGLQECRCGFKQYIDGSASNIKHIVFNTNTFRVHFDLQDLKMRVFKETLTPILILPLLQPLIDNFTNLYYINSHINKFLPFL